METLCCPPCSLVLQQHPEMTVDKQWEQTVTPTSIDLLPPPPTPTLINNATLIPPTLNLYESPTAPPPFSTRTDKNDKWPAPSSLCHHLPVPRVGCPRHYKLISPLRNPIEWAPPFLGSVHFFLFSAGGWWGLFIASGPSYNFHT